MLDVLDEQPPELLLVPDQGPVEQLVAQGADPSLRVGVRLGCSQWDPQRGDPEGWLYWGCRSENFQEEAI